MTFSNMIIMKEIPIFAMVFAEVRVDTPGSNAL
jgi:hypothetical protein